MIRQIIVYMSSRLWTVGLTVYLELYQYTWTVLISILGVKVADIIEMWYFV